MKQVAFRLTHHSGRVFTSLRAPPGARSPVTSDNLELLGSSSTAIEGQADVSEAPVDTAAFDPKRTLRPINQEQGTNTI